MTFHTFSMTEEKADMVHKLVSSHIQALQNWTASAVERGDLIGAQELVRQQRDHETLFAAFNMPAKHTIAKHSEKELKTEHVVREGKFL